MNWRPWQRRETRQTDGYTSIVRAALHRAASGNIGQLSDLAAIQGSAQLLGRSLSVARVEPQSQLVEGVTAEFLYNVGSRLILEGRAVDLLDGWRRRDTALLSFVKLATHRHLSARHTRLHAGVGRGGRCGDGEANRNR